MRRAHCIGCGVTFEKMHHMINHRRNERCGGRFLPDEERKHLMTAKDYWQKWNNPFRDFDTENSANLYREYRRSAQAFYNLRRMRLRHAQQL